MRFEVYCAMRNFDSPKICHLFTHSGSVSERLKEMTAAQRSTLKLRDLMLERCLINPPFVAELRQYE